jgi:hypothetical protein
VCNERITRQLYAASSPTSAYTRVHVTSMCPHPWETVCALRLLDFDCIVRLRAFRGSAAVCWLTHKPHNSARERHTHVHLPLKQQSLGQRRKRRWPVFVHVRPVKWERGVRQIQKKKKKKHDSSVSVPRQTCIVTDLDPCSWGSYLTNTNLTLNLNLAAWLPSNP